MDNLVKLSECYEVTIDAILNKDNTYLSSNYNNNVLKSDVEINNLVIKDDGLILLTISLICCALTPLGIIIAPIIFKKNKAENTLYRLIYITCIFCFAINIYLFYGLVIDVLGLGSTSFNLIN